MTPERKYGDGEEHEGGLDPEELRAEAHKELEIARLMGPSDDLELAWLQYLEQLVELTDTWLAQARAYTPPRRP